MRLGSPSPSPSRPSRSRDSAQSPSKSDGHGKGSHHHHFTVDFDRFYADRVHRFEHERAMYKSYLKILEPKKQETHHLVWQNKKLAEQSRLAKFEREQVQKRTLEVQQEIDRVRKEIESQTAAQAERKQQMLKLMELSGPVERDQTFLVRDRFPSREPSAEDVARSKPRVMRVSIADAGFDMPGPNDKASKKSKGVAQTERRRPLWQIVKTGEIIQKEQRVREETLRAHAQLQSLQQALQAAEEDNHRQEVEAQRVSEEDVKNSRELFEEVDKYEFQCYHAVAELLKLRFRIMVAQREEVEELERLQQEKALFVAKEEKLKSELLDEMSRMNRDLKKELDESTREFRRQLADMDLQLSKLLQEEAGMKEEKEEISHEQEVLKENLEILKQRLARMKRRYALEMEGYQTESMGLRKQLQLLEKFYFDTVQQKMNDKREKIGEEEEVKNQEKKKGKKKKEAQLAVRPKTSRK